MSATDGQVGLSQSEVHLIPLQPSSGSYLVFAPLHGVTAVVNHSAATVLREGSSLESADLMALAQSLAVEAPPPPHPSGPAQPPFLGLIVTRGCNMACKYCDFGATPAGETMSPALVSRALGGWADWVRSHGGASLNLHFFGGEPFTKPDLIEVAVLRTRHLAQQYGLGTRFEACTNGLLGPRMVSFVRDYFTAVVLSLDGQAEDHDRHRPLHDGSGSFSTIWPVAEALADSPVELCVRCCVSSANAERMADTARWLSSTLRPQSITFEPLKPSPEAQETGLVPPEPMSFVRGFVAARRIALAAGIECIYSALFGVPRRTFCPVGRDTFILAPDGSLRSCYLPRHEWADRGLDLVLGAVTEDGALDVVPEAVDRLRRLTATRARCEGCFCRWGCAGGCLVTETPPGHSADYSDFCRQTRLLQACVLLEELGLPEHTDALLADPAAAAEVGNCRETGVVA